eukprot:gnl/TRDRNA2_/TRDRNA2_43502_c0_seq1.p1 gnl/TRDRNA2_/TRDRNA2_43502_c0~~gnl/TRDRNA2_/TRDRNA2_43502_c0_seq1.p1  ORF type:complete len:249 (-),score=42.51 gnl/TRDRNA2_/TRDRNA2_43502_c0_seq1:79-825(-)
MARDSGAYEGFDSATGPISNFLESLEVVRVESMDVSNDPRFFGGNIIDKRLKAFGGLTLINGVMVGTSIHQCFGMKKDQDFETFFGIVQAVGFVLMNLVAFMTLTSIVVLVHQMFYTTRLSTSGPSGFEIAATFYLNTNIIAFRHFAMKCMLLSLPIFLVSSGLSLFAAFHKDAQYKPPEHELEGKYHDILGVVVCVGFFLASCWLMHIRWVHLAIFRERYEIVKMNERPLLTHVRDLATKKDEWLDT